MCNVLKVFIECRGWTLCPPTGRAQTEQRPYTSSILLIAIFIFKYFTDSTMGYFQFF